MKVKVPPSVVEESVFFLDIFDLTLGSLSFSNFFSL